MSGQLRIPRIIFGPRETGRGFDLIARSDGVELPTSALAAARDFNLRIGDHVVPGIDIHACFQISRPGEPGLWFVSTTCAHGVALGNPIWVSWGVALDQAAMDALAGRTDLLLGALHGSEPPTPDDRVPPILFDTARLRSTTSGAAGFADGLHDYLGHLGLRPLTIAVQAPLDEIAMVGAVLGAVPRTWRDRASYVTAPIPVRDWQLIVYDEGRWRDLPRWLPRSGASIRAGPGGIEGGPPASMSEMMWRLFTAAAETLPGGSDLAARLTMHRGTAVDDDSPATMIEARVGTALIDEMQARGARAAAHLFAQAVTAASAIAEQGVREIAMRGLRGVLAQLLPTINTRTWFFADLHALPAAVREDLSADALLARIAAETGAVFSIGVDQLRALDRYLLGDLLPVVRREAESGKCGEVASETQLLAQIVARLDCQANDRAALWALAYALAQRLIRDTAALPEDQRVIRSNSIDVLVELLERIVRRRRSRGIEAMFKASNRTLLRRLLGQEYLATLVMEIRNGAPPAPPNGYDYRFALTCREYVRP